MSDRALWAQAQQDYTQALAIANLAWAARGDATPEAIQAATATLLIHVTKLRERGGVTPQPAAAAVKRGIDGPQSAAVGVPACPQCNGPMYDNRPKKASGEFKPTSADFTCKDKECKTQSKGGQWYRTGVWEKDLKKNPAYAGAVAIRDQVDEGFDKFPKALNDDSDDLPF